MASSIQLDLAAAGMQEQLRVVERVGEAQLRCGSNPQRVQGELGTSLGRNQRPPLEPVTGLGGRRLGVANTCHRWSIAVCGGRCRTPVSARS